MTMKLYTEEDIQAIANAIRTQNGSSDTYKVSEMADAILEIPTGGGDELTLLQRFIGKYTMTNVTIPGVTRIGANSGAGSFLEGAISFPDVTAVNGQAFYQSNKITSINLPKMTSISGQAFQQATLLESIYCPLITSIPSNTFRQCSHLEYFVGQSVTSGQSTGTQFYGCTALKGVDIIGNTSGFGANFFQNCSALNVLILRKTDGISALTATSAFSGTPFASSGSGGTLYVPSSLISSYQSATNWSTILGYTNNQILQIEGSIYETQYADGTPIV